MQDLNLPSYNCRIKEGEQGVQIFDSLRKKFVTLTPEEWVRQHFINFLITEKNYPASFFAIEKEHKLNELKKRSDLLVYDKNLKPWMIVEFKSADVTISQEAFYQIARYNLTHDVKYLVVSNGIEHYCCVRVEDRFEFMDDLPEYGI